MPSINDLSESKFLGKDDVGEGKLITITGYTQENMAKDGDPTEMKYVLKLRDENGQDIKPVSLNVTNGLMIAHIMATTYGISRDYQPDPDDPGGNPVPAHEQFCNWIGKQVILYNDPTIMYQKQMTGGIRVRAPQQQQAPPQQGFHSPPQQQNAPRTDESGPLPTEQPPFNPTDDVPF